MKISYNWLKQFVDLKNIDVVINKLNLSGLEVDGFYKVGDFTGVISARVEKILKIEGSDKLLLCKTFNGKEIIDVITGDTTVKEGEILPLATVGAKLPGNVQIDKREFLGKTSYGMFCSLKELGLYNDASKIYRFSPDTEIGKDMLELWNLPDYVIELEITANRGDALSHLGVARDLGALFDIKVKKDKAFIETVENSLIDNLDIIIKEPDVCKRYSSRIVKNVKVKESPEWMKRDLYLMDSRPINNIVDITNYLLFNYGHPLHVFDYDLLEGKKIIVRYAKNGEKIEALNGETYDLNENVLVIADEKEPIAIAGVIGGAKKSINENTKNVVIESAWFDPVTIRKSRKEIGGLTTDSSYRFERGVDYGNHRFIVDKTAELISTLGNGEIEEKFYDVYPEKIQDRYVEFYANDLCRYLGTNINDEEIITILRKLGFEISLKMNKIKAKVPTYRSDISIFEDIVEEVGRIYGYEKVHSEIPKVLIKPVKKSEKLSLTDRLRDRMVGFGFFEAINYAFAPGWVEDSDLVKVGNPLSKDFENLRNSLIVSLIENAKYNFNRQEKALSLFEIGKSYHKDLSESTHIAALMSSEKEINWKDKEKRDFFDLKGVVQALLKEFTLEFKAKKIKNLHPYQSAVIYSNEIEIGYIGKLDTKFAKQHKLENIYVFEIDIDKLMETKESKKYFEDFSQYPKVRKDLSIEISKEIEIEPIIKSLKSLPNLENIGIFDVYKDKSNPDKVSVAIYMEFRKKDSTLKDEEINELFNLAISKVQKFKNVKIRGLD